MCRTAGCTQFGIKHRVKFGEEAYCKECQKRCVTLRLPANLWKVVGARAGEAIYPGDLLSLGDDGLVYAWPERQIEKGA